MPSSSSVAIAYLAAYASAHGVVTKITGANGVEMPGLSIADGTPRDCSSNGCGSQADTAIIRDREINSGDVGPLGRTQGNGPISAETMINAFMGQGAAPTNNGTGVGVEDNLEGTPAAQGGATNGNNRAAAANRGGNRNNNDNKKRRGGGGGGVMHWARQFSLAGLLGGGGGGANAGTKSTGPPETMVAATAGQGATSGMPTVADDGTITMTFRQINQDGAGPMEAMVDGTSGGTEMAAFQEAKVTQDVPGLGFQGLSLATTTDFPLKVQMPAGMTCDATVGAASNVCVVRVRNGAGAGPFGGAAAFTQTTAQRKRAIEYRMKMRRARAFSA